MEALQAHNPENAIMQQMAASGVTHPYGPGVQQPGPSTAQQLEDARRAVLRNTFTESQASPDILDRAISDSPEQQAQQYGQQPQTHPPGYGPQAAPTQYPAQQQQGYQQAPPQQQAYAPPQASGQPSYDDLLHGLNRVRAENRELAQDREALGAIRELLQDDPEFANELLARVSGQPVPSRQAAPNVDPNAPPPAASQQQRQGPDPYARAALQRIKRLEGALENQARQGEQDRRMNEARELADTMPALFNYEATEAYRQQNNFRSLKDAFYHRLGNAVTFLNVQQQAQARQQQYPPQGGYAPQQQQGYAPQQQGGYNPPQYAPQQQQYGPAPQQGYGPSQYGPPPAQGDPRQMMVMSPGGAPPGPAQQQQRLEQIKAFRPQDKDGLKAKLRAYASATGMR